MCSDISISGGQQDVQARNVPITAHEIVETPEKYTCRGYNNSEAVPPVIIAFMYFVATGC